MRVAGALILVVAPLGFNLFFLLLARWFEYPRDSPRALKGAFIGTRPLTWCFRPGAKLPGGGGPSNGDDESPDSACSGWGLPGPSLSAFPLNIGGPRPCGAVRETPAPFDGPGRGCFWSQV